ncbi:MAG: lytic transglycosylase [Magnetococcus sp. DMHC-8]
MIKANIPIATKNCIMAGRWATAVLLGGLLAVLGGCSSVSTKPDEPPIARINIDDACSIFQGRSSWYQVMDKAYRKWGTPVHVQLAIIHQESKFRSDARPISKGFLGFMPGQRLSSALGYAQALDGTWANYQQQTGNHQANREDFRDAVDFIGWYNHVSHKKLQIAKTDARNLYLAYHEGQGGYAAKSYRKKSWLLRVAEKVERNAARYQTQMARCGDILNARDEKENNWFVWPF